MCSIVAAAIRRVAAATARIGRQTWGERGSRRMLRSVRLFRLFLKEQSDPDGFYAALAGDAASQLAEFTAVRGRTVLDIGGGAGYVTEEFRSRGANCYLFEVDVGEMMRRGRLPPGAVVADGYWLLLEPLAKGTHAIHIRVSASHTSNGPIAFDVVDHITVL